MIPINKYIKHFPTIFLKQENALPWEITQNLSAFLAEHLLQLDKNEYSIDGDIAIHKTAIIEKGAILKAPILISANCFIASHAYLRGGVFLGERVHIGPGCEIKTSIICADSATAHFNFVGDSIIGSHVNFEAGALIANHYNEREDKTIWAKVNSIRMNTGIFKFGALVGDHSKIGANAVLSPGTILIKRSIVNRLELIQQNK